MATEQSIDARVDALLDRGEEVGCLNLSELDELAQALDLNEEAVAALHEQVDRRGIVLSDDCGRANVDPTTYLNGDVAGTTTDALQLFLNEIRRYPLLTAQEEI